MRCRQCLRTGFTEAELQAHVKKLGHKLPVDEKDWRSGSEFESQVAKPPQLSKTELVAALRELYSAEEFAAMLKELATPAKQGA